jgi:hypothetical protein
MLSWTRSSASTSDDARSWGLRGFARAGLVVAWAVFWLNTALFPCWEVAAAVLGGHAGNVSQSVSAVQPAHQPGDRQTGSPIHSPDSRCAYSLSAEPAIVGEYAVPTVDRSPQEWFAVDAPVATGLAAVSHSANLGLARTVPPRSLRLYERTQRLLI